ncbi:hypothetical protein CKAN_01194000 [Cinnamomum micranthum f. kanehirae]|uniref:Uncharacterized protein n=1 Tax=Cinnamomum micranthum f. kanehirae TaxID=337451 RepID=A0A3S4NY75_9MAGN|nr:hypothetical protein CKAN_01194000 [Cinnamomum micranthum f. kanehirae]
MMGLSRMQAQTPDMNTHSSNRDAAVTTENSVPCSNSTIDTIGPSLGSLVFSMPMHIQIGLLQPKSLNMQQSIMDLMGFEKLWFSLVIGECTEDVMDTACSVDIFSNHALHSASVGELDRVFEQTFTIKRNKAAKLLGGRDRMQFSSYTQRLRINRHLENLYGESSTQEDIYRTEVEFSPRGGELMQEACMFFIKT